MMPPPPLTVDEARVDAWARDFQAGDTQALKRLVTTLSRGLIAMAYRYTRDWELARDLTQECWIRAHGSIDSWDSSRSFRAWLLTVHRHGCLSHLRRAFLRERTVEPDAWSEERDRGPDPLERVARREFLDRLHGALDELSESQRRAFVTVDLEQLAPKEAAAALGMNPVTLRTTLHFARRRLARLLGKDES